MTERWLPVVGYEGLYEVSDMGRVWSLRRNRFLLPQRHFNKTKGKLRYPGVGLTINGKAKRHSIHRLMLETFVGPCPEGLEACHKNDIGDDNRLSNLRWDTRSANSHDAIANGRHPQAAKTHCVNGHEYTPENTYLRPNVNGKHCRACQRKRNREQEVKRQQGLLKRGKRRTPTA